LKWLAGYTVGFNFRSITILSKCGVSVESDELPEGASVFQLPNVGRNDHAIAFWMSMIQYSSRDNEVVVFLKDNLDIHQSSRARSVHDTLRITAKTGYAFFQEPSEGMS
jgi:hypothetical protein